MMRQGTLQKTVRKGARAERMARAAGALVLLVPIAAGACTTEEPPLELPTLVEAASPFVYPEDLWDANVEGQAVVMVHVTAEGAVDSVYVRSTSGYQAMDSAAAAGARQLRFNPGRRGEELVESWVRLPVRFSKAPPAGAQAVGQGPAEVPASSAGTEGQQPELAQGDGS